MGLVRTQIQLTEEQFAAIKAASASENISIAEFIRMAVDKLLETKGAVGLGERAERAIEVAGKFRSGLTDLAEKHDAYFAETLGRTREKEQ